MHREAKLNDGPRAQANRIALVARKLARAQFCTVATVPPNYRRNLRAHKFQLEGKPAAGTTEAYLVHNQNNCLAPVSVTSCSRPPGGNFRIKFHFGYYFDRLDAAQAHGILVIWPTVLWQGQFGGGLPPLRMCAEPRVRHNARLFKVHCSCLRHHRRDHSAEEHFIV